MGSRTWHTEQERSSTGWIRIVIWFYRLLGKRFCELLMWPVSGFFFLVDRKGRAASLGYIDHAYSAEAIKPFWFIRRYWLSRCHFYEFARALLDKFAAWQGGVQFESLSFEGRERLHALAKEQKGAIIMGAHLGNIEVLRAVGQDMRGLKINALMFTEHNPGFKNVLESSHPEFSFRIIPTESPGPQLLIELQECLERGEIVAMLADRLMPGSPEKSVPATFFGDTAQFPAGPFILTSVLDRPIFLVFCFRDGSGYHSYFELFEERLTLPRKNREAALAEAVQKFASRLEFYCQKFPLQWYNFYSFWDAGNESSKDQPSPATQDSART